MKKLLVSALAGVALFAGFALAQSIVPQAPNINPTDLIQIVPLGQPSAQSFYATPAQIAGAPGYTDLGVATSGNTYTFNHGQTYMFMRPSATLAAVTLVTESNPSDGQRECFLSTQTTTALTWNAATGQSIANAPAAGVANTTACMTYVKSIATWERS